MKLKHVPVFAVILLTAALAFSADPVRIHPDRGPCDVDVISVPNVSTTSWTGGVVGQKWVVFQSTNAVDVFMGFDAFVTTTTGYGFYDIGDEIKIPIDDNMEVWFVGNGASGSIRAVTCN